MLQRIKIISLLAIALPLVSYANNLCTVEQIIDTPVAKRSLKIQFPGGRRILIVGHEHGLAGSKFLLSDLVNQNIETLSNSDFTKKVSSIIDLERHTILEQRQDLVFLKDHATKESDIKFIGLEYPQERIRSQFLNMAKFQSDLLRQTNLRNISFSNPYQDSVLLFFNATFYLKMTEPKYLIGYELAGFDSENLIRKNWIAYKAIIDMRKNIGEIRPDILNIFATIENSFLELYPTYELNNNDNNILNLIKKQISYQDKEIIDNWISVQLQEMKASKRRDEFFAQRMLSRNQSGILFIGKRHLHSIAGILKKKCELSINSNRRI
jgi:hypothetical protein